MNHFVLPSHLPRDIRQTVLSHTNQQSNMKFTTGIALLFAVCAHTANAQPVQSAADSARLEIDQLTQVWNTAIVQRDSVMLENLLAPCYTLNGMVERKTWITNTLQHLATDTLEVLGKMSITVFDNSARSEGTIHWTVSFDARPRMNADFTITDIWTKQNGRWQVLLRMASPPRMR